jgi:murein DD-endopeptidase MepM/ murein hydrolase activator NlpD
MPRRVTLFILSLLLLSLAVPVSAQTSTPAPGPIYIVQEGDTLWDIASRFNVTVSELQAANNLSTQDIFVGDELVIPGLEELTGTLVTKAVPFGETLRSLSRQYRVDPAILRKLNHIVSPSELYAGYELVILQQDDQPAWNTRASLGQGETLLELAVKADSDPWTIAQINGIAGPVTVLPGDTIYLPSGASTSASGLPAAILSAELDPLPLVQGTTAQIKIVTSTTVALSGGSIQSFEQMMLVKSGNFINDPVLDVEPSTIDPAVTGPEDEWLLSLVSVVTPEKFWTENFQLPVDIQDCPLSLYGNRRSYNGGALHGFHTGVDFGVCSEAHPFDVYAPADGVVVFTGLKTVRGNATIIDHGWGVFSGLYHQAEINVAAGDHVTAGQLIGKIGATGRVTGSHLHWELWVNGVQVNPLEWLETSFPR